RSSDCRGHSAIAIPPNCLLTVRQPRCVYFPFFLLSAPSFFNVKTRSAGRGCGAEATWHPGRRSAWCTGGLPRRPAPRQWHEAAGRGGGASPFAGASRSLSLLRSPSPPHSPCLSRKGNFFADCSLLCSFCLGGTRDEEENKAVDAMGQLCCFPFSRGEEKISEKHAAEPDDAELVSLSKRLVENAVLKAVQQYLEETQNKNRQTDGSPVKTEEAGSGSKNENDNDSSK
uniref:A-kinase anchor protein 7 RI-RII subunit-binding domain-containing protein n=1 Tax=Dromaius novaehollandiae TaxID=8790 RepID=A0A8C4JR58_DRONO